MESYVVRIYRRGKEKTKELVGVVEHPGDAAQRAFRTPDELSNPLLSGIGVRAKRAKGPARPATRRAPARGSELSVGPPGPLMGPFFQSVTNL